MIYVSAWNSYTSEHVDTKCNTLCIHKTILMRLKASYSHHFDGMMRISTWWFRFDENLCRYMNVIYL